MFHFRYINIVLPENRPCAIWEWLVELKSYTTRYTFHLVLIFIIALGAIHTVLADQPLTRTQMVQLNPGQSLVIQSDQNSIQQVFVEGNLTAANFTKSAQYPARNFELQSLNSGGYALRVAFNYPNDYKVNLFVRDPDANVVKNNTMYYLSGGAFELDVNATFNPRPDNRLVVTQSISPWDSFVNWIGKFGEAFPLWVKMLYMIFGIQFFTVGGLWIRRETIAKETTTQRLDAGDRAYLWLDVAYKFLLASFVAIIAIMGGELLILFVLRFMFLASLDLLSLWDLFVIGFAAGAVIMFYMIRFTLERAFDLKPAEDE